MKERKAWQITGYGAIILILILWGAAAALLGANIDTLNPAIVVAAALLIGAGALLSSGLTIIQPNEAQIVTFFGKYIGTLSQDGFWLTVPLSSRKKISLKVRNFNSHTLKVNDAEGNPIEIAAVVVFRVEDTARATFDVDNYERFVEIQSETAIRHIAAHYPYDQYSEEVKLTLRGNSDEVAAELLNELQQRLIVAGVTVLETRLTHLAYSPEIASAMLQRQQAMAIVAARQKIVEGAVTMVDAALRQLRDKGIDLDGERRAAMVNNLMVAIVSERGTTPVINTGTLYN
ncbi:SPFH domain-containing protein [Paenibacillus sp. SYP-B4298]|uniref:SPFH domain-containing protein n=1 Tax=Paenibacillus sp. SYP-B4298 TaxID=2996034 RepID=UPI0022DDD189|nr:SPFH domain-containing protein [Paenibacillus sp. SYP-B4298]